MKYIALFEDWRRPKVIKLTRGNYLIRIEVLHGKIERIENPARIRCPFFPGQPVTIFMKHWACENHFKINGVSACGDTSPSASARGTALVN